jgi:hypothetical protein
MKNIGEIGAWAGAILIVLVVIVGELAYIAIMLTLQGGA